MEKIVDKDQMIKDIQKIPMLGKSTKCVLVALLENLEEENSIRSNFNTLVKFTPHLSQMSVRVAMRQLQQFGIVSWMDKQLTTYLFVVNPEVIKELIPN